MSLAKYLKLWLVSQTPGHFQGPSVTSRLWLWRSGLRADGQGLHIGQVGFSAGKSREAPGSSSGWQCSGGCCQAFRIPARKQHPQHALVRASLPPHAFL